MIANILFALAMIFSPATATPADTYQGLPICQYEDSENCYWDAETEGNGEGESFHDVNGVAYYPCVANEDSANCFWDATKQGNGVGRSFTDVDGVAIWWDEVGTEVAEAEAVADEDMAAWAVWDMVGADKFVSDDDGTMVEVVGPWNGSTLEQDQVAAWDSEGNAYLYQLSEIDY